MKTVEQKLETALGGLNKALTNLATVERQSEEEMAANEQQIATLQKRNDEVAAVRDRAARVGQRFEELLA